MSKPRKKDLNSMIGKTVRVKFRHDIVGVGCLEKDGKDFKLVQYKYNFYFGIKDVLRAEVVEDDL